MKINKNKKKALTLIETLVSISIISLLLLVIIQILLLLSKYNKRTGYVQEADLKTKEIAIKIERILYNKEISLFKQKREISFFSTFRKRSSLTRPEKQKQKIILGEFNKKFTIRKVEKSSLESQQKRFSSP
ncbi:MAG: prepilin-type N-terminal cleavage/methylation domain-containing protein [bacterium]